MCWLSEALIESRQFIRWLHRWRPYIASLYWRTPHLLLRFICLHEGAILPLLLRFFWPDFVRFLLGFLRLHFCDCSSGTLFSSWWSAIEYRRCQLPCPLYITSDGPHSNCVKCMGFSHTPEVVYGISKCKLFENFISKPSALGWQFLRGSPERPLRPSVNSEPGARFWSSRRWRTSRRASPILSLSRLSTCTWILRLNISIFEYLFPSPEARNIISFRLDNMLFTAGSDSEDFGPALADALPPSGQKARPSAAYS